MKNLTYTLAILLLVSSCRSIDKMVESGEYDKALQFGADRLRGEKNKKTKYVKGLEKAYNRLNDRDLKEIAYYESEDRAKSYDRIIQLYHKLNDRQNYVEPLLPLYSKDGYYADITLTDYSAMVIDAKKNASEKNYTSALESLNIAKETGNKFRARRAYQLFKDSEHYFDTYKESAVLRVEAYNIGQNNILIETYMAGSNNAFDYTKQIMSQLSPSQLNTTWNKYFTLVPDGLPVDYIATIEISDIYPGKEIEYFKTYTKEKDIKAGKRPKKSATGQLAKDTFGNIVYVEKMKTISATIDEILREKSSSITGRLVIVSATNGNHISTTPLDAIHIFEDYACTIQGDKRALDDITIKRIKPYCAPFPSDYDMTTMSAVAYKEIATETLRNTRL